MFIFRLSTGIIFPVLLLMQYYQILYSILSFKYEIMGIDFMKKILNKLWALWELTFSNNWFLMKKHFKTSKSLFRDEWHNDI